MKFCLGFVWLAVGYGFLPSSTNRIRHRYYPTATSYAVSTAVLLERGQENEEEPASDENAATTTPTRKLWTYVHNLSKTRRRTHQEGPAGIRSILYSFMIYLEQLSQSASPLCSTSPYELQEALETSTIQALRAAGGVGDYRFILELMNVISAMQPHFSISPRLWGEAIAAMAETSANASKLKQLWQLAREQKDTSLGAYELNVMLRALASRGKIRAALELYEDTSTSIVGDAYTCSTLLNALSESIIPNQAVAKDWTPKSEESPCWQYTTGWDLLQAAPSNQLNNHVFAAALALNERAAVVFDAQDRRHYASKAAMNILELTRERNVCPDVITCSAVMSAFDRGFQWKAAIALLDSMKNQRLQTDSSRWSLPLPNAHIYSSIISACARCSEYDAALDVLEDMRQLSKTQNTVKLNTWVYNAALAACARGGGGHKRTERAQMALELLEQMRESHWYNDDEETAPDLVSYNTALAALDGMGTVIDKHSGRAMENGETIVDQLLDEMKSVGLARDSLTYRNAVKALRGDGLAVLRILDVALLDMTGRATEGLASVFNTALSVLCMKDDIQTFEMTLAKMQDARVPINAETMNHVISALGKSGNSSSILALLDVMGEGSKAIESFQQFPFDISWMTDSIPSLSLQHCSTAITACLSANQMESAHQILTLMRKKNLTPDKHSMECIALAYCRLATEASAEESKLARRRRKSQKGKATRGMEAKRRLSASRAQSAVVMVGALEEVSVRLLSSVTTSCCAAGMWHEARTMLRKIHHIALEEAKGRKELETRNGMMRALPGLHRSLFKLCASRGNVTAAIGFVDDIQAFSQQLESSEESEGYDSTLSTFLEKSFHCSMEDDLCSVSQAFDSSTYQIGMTGEDWKLLLIAASKSGHWRLCLCTLQFLRPYVEATHPSLTSAEDPRIIQRRYEKLARSLTSAVLCFEMRSQYAWAIRVIDDWIMWSGRRPRTEAVLSACRILAARGRGYEVNALVNRVIQVPLHSEEENDSSYETIIFSGAMSALHSHGLYEDADELFVQAYSEGYFPYLLERDGLSQQCTLDLHGMNVGMANSAVRITLQQQALSAENQTEGSLIIITGRGRNSAQRLRPILRPEVQRMLSEEFYPPLSTSSIPGNLGALRVPSNDISLWVQQQREQKGARMLAIADALKNLTSGDRLRRALRLPQQEAGDDE